MDAERTSEERDEFATWINFILTKTRENKKQLERLLSMIGDGNGSKNDFEATARLINRLDEDIKDFKTEIHRLIDEDRFP